MNPLKRENAACEPLLTITCLACSCSCQRLSTIILGSNSLCLSNTSNQRPLLVLHATQRGMLSANGAVEPVSSSSVITCCAKFLQETLHVLSVPERALPAAWIVKEPVFVQSGWENLL